jgi:hypothetical protein
VSLWLYFLLQKHKVYHKRHKALFLLKLTNKTIQKLLLGKIFINKLLVIKDLGLGKKKTTAGVVWFYL